MLRLLKSAGPLMLLIVLAFAGTAEAHYLEMPRAIEANKTFAKVLCGPSEDPEVVCVKSAPGPCNRVSAHRVRCTIDLTVESKEDGSQVRCRNLMEWSVRNKSLALRPNFLGVRSCKQVKAPVAPLP